MTAQQCAAARLAAPGADRNIPFVGRPLNLRPRRQRRWAWLRDLAGHIRGVWHPAVEIGSFQKGSLKWQ